MVIQKLVECYHTLQAGGHDVAPLGWNRQPISYQLDIGYDGTINGLLDVRESYTDRNGKEQKRPAYYLLPCHEQARSNNDNSYFLWDNGSYVFASKARRPKRREHHIDVHREILGSASFPEALALLKFFGRYSDKDLQTYLTDTAGISLTAAEGMNFMYSVDGKICGMQSVFKDIWNTFFHTWLDKQPKGIDIITNQESAICNTHMPIKPCANLANGAALSFTNYASVYYHTQKQGMVAPMSYETVKAYTQAASYMAKNKKYHMNIGNLKILFWTETQGREMDYLSEVLTGVSQSSQEYLQKFMVRLLQGENITDIPFDMSEPVYVLGISTDISGKTISVAFFEQSIFGTIYQNVKNHYDRSRILGWQKDTDGNWIQAIMSPKSVYQLKAIMEQNGNNCHQQSVQQLLNAVLFGHPYPIELFVCCQKQAMKEPIHWSQASVLKAYHLHSLPKNDDRRECCSVGLNETCTDTAYLLGRLFACHEKIQANAKELEGKKAINLHERYFSSAMATPRPIFAVLSSINNIYLKKLPKAHQIFFEKKIGEIKDQITEYPSQLSLTDQSMFDLGYYHQRQAFFTKQTNENETEGGKQE